MVQNVTPGFVTVGGAAVMISLGSDNVATLSGEFLDPVSMTLTVWKSSGATVGLQRVDIAVGQRNFFRATTLFKQHHRTAQSIPSPRCASMMKPKAV